MASVWMSLARADAKRIFRDRFLLLIATYLPLMALGFRWAIPALADTVHEQLELRPYYPFISAVLVLILPFVMGCVLGLQLLEEKDERSLSAVVVTPFSFGRYFLFRVLTYACVGTLMLILSHETMGLVRSITLARLGVVAVAFSLSTALSACVIGILAKNQVQGFAVLKGSGFLFTLPALSFFVPTHWDLLFGVIPFYWPIKAYYVAVSGGSSVWFWAAVTLSFITQGGAFIPLYRMLNRRMRED